MFVDPELYFLEEKVFSSSLNTTGAWYHVPEVEKYIQVIKERIRAHNANLPFHSFTRRITIELAKHDVMFLESFPPNSGMSKTYIPRTIITNKALDWNKIFKLHFGAYAEVHKYRNVTNTLE